MTHRIDLMAGPIQVIISTSPQPLPRCIFRWGFNLRRLVVNIYRNDRDVTGHRLHVMYTSWAEPEPPRNNNDFMKQGLGMR
jgi:hypothetical protein